MYADQIIIRGLTQNNLKNVSITISKRKITVFTGVSGSGKSSIVFDTVAAEAARQMNETYPAFVRSRMPKYEKPRAERIENLSPAVIVDQTALGGNARSTVGTASELYTGLRLLYSRIGEPQLGPSSCFSFNDPAGMCQTCGGLGRVTDIDMDAVLDPDRSLAEGAVRESSFRVGSWYYKQYAKSGLFDLDKKLRDYTPAERKLLLYGEARGKGTAEHPRVEGLYNYLKRRYLTRDVSMLSCYQQDKSARLVSQKLCPDCGGRRISRSARACWINGVNIAEASEMELPELRRFLRGISDPRVQLLLETLIAGLTRMIDIGLPYLSLSRETGSLSGGEAQRLKLVRCLGSSLSDLLYIFDEPSTGLHPRDVYRMNRLLTELRDAGNTVLVVEHDRDVIAIADEVIDVGPRAGANGGEIVFSGAYPALLAADTVTGRALRKQPALNAHPRKPTGFLPVRGATLHNLKNADADFPLGVLCAVTGVAGSGKSSLVSGVFAARYADRVVRVDQSPITATRRSTPASFLGFFDAVRKLFAKENGVSEGMFSYNSEGACPKCEGRGATVTELAYMDPVVTTCELCGGKRFCAETLSYTYRGKNILEVLALTASEAADFFDEPKILRAAKAMCEAGLGYMTLGQPLSTLSGGERQRLKLAAALGKKGSVFVLDEPTTGLHPSDCEKLVSLFDRLIARGNTVLVIEHNLDIVMRADYIIDVGPDGGKNGGRVVFTGTPAEMAESADTVTAKCLRAALAGRALTGAELASCAQNETQAETTEVNDMSDMKLMPIGRIENGSAGAALVLDAKYAPALAGLAGFSHVQVLWWCDGCAGEADRAVLSMDKPYKKGPDTLGTFATRAPQRPNPVAITTAAITYIDPAHARVGLGYIDALDGTPLIDLKPYTPSLDRVEAPGVPAWCAHWPKSAEESGDFDWAQEFNF